MASTSSRTLRLLSLLQTRRYWAGVELAERLEVSLRTLRRDIERLRELGYPVEAHRGVDGGYQLAAGATLPPLVLDEEEAVAIAVGLQTTAQGAVAGLAESSVRALAKVAQVMPPGLRHRVDALRAMTVAAAWDSTGPTVDPAALTTIAQACRDTERLEFAYTARGGERTPRHVDPHRLVLLGRRWYLVAYDQTRHDWRSFRLDRLDHPRRTGARFRPRELPTDDAAAFVRAGIDNLPTPYVIEVLVEAPATVVLDRVGRWASVEHVDAGRCLLKMRTDSLDWPAMALGALEADFTVLSPPELIDRLRNWARRFRRATARARAS